MRLIGVVVRSRPYLSGSGGMAIVLKEKQVGVHHWRGRFECSFETMSFKIYGCVIRQRKNAKGGDYLAGDYWPGYAPALFRYFLILHTVLACMPVSFAASAPL